MSKYFTVIVSFLVAMLATAGAFLSFRMPAASVGKAITRSMATSASPKEQAEKAIKENDIMVLSPFHFVVLAIQTIRIDE